MHQCANDRADATADATSGKVHKSWFLAFFSGSGGAGEEGREGVSPPWDTTRRWPRLLRVQDFVRNRLIWKALIGLGKWNFLGTVTTSHDGLLRTLGFYVLARDFHETGELGGASGSSRWVTLPGFEGSDCRLRPLVCKELRAKAAGFAKGTGSRYKPSPAMRDSIGICSAGRPFA